MAWILKILMPMLWKIHGFANVKKCAPMVQGPFTLTFCNKCLLLFFLHSVGSWSSVSQVEKFCSFTYQNHWLTMTYATVGGPLNYFDQQGFLNVHLNLSTWAFSHFTPTEMRQHLRRPRTQQHKYCGRWLWSLRTSNNIYYSVSFTWMGKQVGHLKLMLRLPCALS